MRPGSSPAEAPREPPERRSRREWRPYTPPLSAEEAGTKAAEEREAAASGAESSPRGRTNRVPGVAVNVRDCSTLRQQRITRTVQCEWGAGVAQQRGDLQRITSGVRCGVSVRPPLGGRRPRETCGRGGLSVVFRRAVGDFEAVMFDEAEDDDGHFDSGAAVPQ